MKSEWAKVVKSQSLFWPQILKARGSDAGQVGITMNGSPFGRTMIFLSNGNHGNQMECSKQAFTVLKGMESPFSGWRWREERLIQRRLSLKLVHFMPDVVRYAWYELLTTFLGAVAAPLLISDSDFGSEQIVPAHSGPAVAQNRDQLNQGRQRWNHVLTEVINSTETDFEHYFYG